MKVYKIFIKMLIALSLFMTFIVNGQDIKNNCYFSSADTIIMIGSVGGMRFMIDQNYFLEQTTISLNVKDLRIKSFNFGLWGDDSIYINEGDTIPLIVQNIGKNRKLGMFFINDLILVTDSGSNIKMDKEFIIYFK